MLHCIYTFVYQCIEGEENYYYNKVDGTCKLWDYNYTHCKYGYEDEFCIECKEGFYINQTNQLCYNNSEKIIFINVLLLNRIFVSDVQIIIF